MWWRLQLELHLRNSDLSDIESLDGHSWKSGSPPCSCQQLIIISKTDRSRNVLHIEMRNFHNCEQDLNQLHEIAQWPPRSSLVIIRFTLQPTLLAEVAPRDPLHAMHP